MQSRFLLLFFFCVITACIVIGASGRTQLAAQTHSTTYNVIFGGGTPPPTATATATAQPTPTPTATPPLITPNPNLNVVSNGSYSAVTLTSSSTTDRWRYFDRANNLTYVEYSAAGADITDKVTLGGATVAGNSFNTTVSYTDGLPTATQSLTPYSVYYKGAVGSGVSFTAPADTSLRTVTIYGGAFCATAGLTASLSDGSQPTITDVSFVAPTTTVVPNVWVVTYKAASAGQTLTLALQINADQYGSGCPNTGASAGVFLQATTEDIVVSATPTPDPFNIVAVPTITPEPLAANPATTLAKHSDVIAAGLAIDSSIAPGYPYAEQLNALCNNWYGHFRCFRNIRDGLWSGTTAGRIADLNFLTTQYGINNAYTTNTGLSVNALTTAAATHACAPAPNNCIMMPANEPEANQYGLFINSSTAIHDMAIPFTTAYSTFPVSTVVTVGENSPETDTIASYSDNNIVNLALPLSSAHKGGVNTTLVAPLYSALTTTNAALGSTGTTVIPVVSTAYFRVGEPITLDTGASAETLTIASIPGDGTLTTGATTKIHATGVSVVAAIINQIAFQILATPVPTPLPNIIIPINPATGSGAVMEVANATNIAAGDKITINCSNQGSQPDIVQVASTYATPIPVANPAGFNIPLVAPPGYSHNANAYDSHVVEGCIRMQPQNNWGILPFYDGELGEFNTLFGSRFKICNVAALSSNDLDAYLPLYGGAPLTYNNFTCGQVHNYPSGNAEGGDGAGVALNQYGNSHPACFGFYCSYSSWQYHYSGALAETGNSKPIYGTEYGWAIAPVGVYSAGSSYNSNTQITDSVGVAWVPRTWWMLANGYAQMNMFNLENGPTSFCQYGLLMTPACGGTTTGYGLAAGSPAKPKASYYAYTDLISILTDDGCISPGCVLSPDSFTWGWSTNVSPIVNVGKINDTHGTGHVRSWITEKADGSVNIIYDYAATDYLQASGVAGTYQWCGDATNNANHPASAGCMQDTLTIAGSHNWANCINIDTTIDPASPNFGHMLPQATVSFNASDQITLTLRPEVQILQCTSTGLNPSRTGAPVPFATPVPGQVATPEATPMPVASPTIVPSPPALAQTQVHFPIGNTSAQNPPVAMATAMFANSVLQQPIASTQNASGTGILAIENNLEPDDYQGQAALNWWYAKNSGAGGQGQAGSLGILGWDGSLIAGYTPEPGWGMYFVTPAQAIDANKWNYECNQGNTGYCGWSGKSAAGNSPFITFDNLYIPPGAQAENSNQSGCDCHLRVVEPPHWFPHATSGASATYVDIYPYQYEVDLFDVATVPGCTGTGGASGSCAGKLTFNGPGTLYSVSGVVVSTGSSGFYGGSSSWNDGFAGWPSGTGNAVPQHSGGSFEGAANHGNDIYAALAISAEDIDQGAILHVTGLGPVCADASLGDIWPSGALLSDTYCKYTTGESNGDIGSPYTGWAYGDHLYLDRTLAQICNAAPVLTYTGTNCTSTSDAVAWGFNDPIQVMYAISLSTYGAIIKDTGHYAPTFAGRLWNGDPYWQKVGQEYGLTLMPQQSNRGIGYLVNIALPIPYLLNGNGTGYMHSVHPCAVPSNPHYNAGNPTGNCGTSAA